MNLFTIGTTRTTAEAFFARLSAANVQSVVDVRLNRSSQLAGFAKMPDLAFFLRAVTGIPYRHEPLLAPTAKLFTAYKKEGGAWEDYVQGYTALLDSRDVGHRLAAMDFAGACLLCSEPAADNCHRRLAAEYLTSKWKCRVDIIHL
ncbi:MAG: DUF488 domain-containing protein [Rhodospirillales bacterium]|nr:DUF488 domain-containing protein [Rhodospirillales bacterium]